MGLLKKYLTDSFIAGGAELKFDMSGLLFLKNDGREIANKITRYLPICHR